MAAAFVLGAVTALAGCSISELPGELSAGDCSDGDDNDEDGPADCADIDCRAFAECTQQASSGTDAPLPAPGQIGDAYVEMRDSGIRGPITSAPPPQEPEMDDEPDLPVTDAAPDPNTQCPEGCDADQICLDGTCVDDDADPVTAWDIVRIQAVAPRSTGNSGTVYACLDPEWVCIPPTTGISPYIKCTCMADPKVEVWLDQDPTDDVDFEKIGTTPAQIEKDSAEWLDTGFTLHLLPTSVLRLMLFDYDDATTAEYIFDCEKPAAPLLDAQALECSRPFPAGDPAATQSRIRIEVAPSDAAPE